MLLETTPKDNSVQMDAGVASHVKENLQAILLKLVDTSRIQIQIQIMIVMILGKVIVMILEIVPRIRLIRVDHYTVCYHQVDSRIKSLKKMMNLKNIQNENRKKVKGKKKNGYQKIITDSY